MATYAVGDLQGCLTPLDHLLERVAFDPAIDRLWLVGDLVNRGPQSLECLRRIRDLGSAAVTVLGNHDLHLLATAAGIRQPRPRDTLSPILESPDGPELLEWLAGQPLLHHDPELGWTMVHAGIPPQWDLQTAIREAAAVSLALREPFSRQPFLRQMYGDEPAQWNPRLNGIERLRFAVNALTRMRFLHSDGRLDFSDKRPPEEAGTHLQPWFAAPDRAMQGQRIVFGHWSALGVRQGKDWLSLDSGCVWGRKLTMVRLEAEVNDNPQFWRANCPN